MSAILLVRHGQASWGAADYDILSDKGALQAHHLGSSWGAAGRTPTRTYAGSLRRHGQTAAAVLDAAGTADAYEGDPGWDEYAHEAIIGAYHPGFASRDRKEFRAVFADAVRRWTSGDRDADYAETYAAFTGRVLGAFDKVAGALGKGETAAVFTSGGPIGVIAAHLLAGGATRWTPETTALWWRLNNVVVNTGVTTVTIGSSGRTLLSFNEHTHLPADAVTYW